MSEKKFSRESELLHKGKRVRGMSLKPETMPIFMTTAFTFDDLSDAKRAYDTKDFTYIRTRNPTRMGLEEMVSYLENGEKTHVTASGMGAITSTIVTLMKSGDHMLCNSNIYGETYDLFTNILSGFGYNIEMVNFEDAEEVKKHIKPNTKLLYTEVLSNPCVSMCDIPALAEAAHSNNAVLIVDNTFTTPFAIKPLDYGADIVIHSLTKFLNGHSDALSGSVTSTEEFIDRLIPVSMLLGTPGEPFNSYLVLRGIKTSAIRLPRQMKTAAKLAEMLEKHPKVTKVNYPGLASYPQRALADKLFVDKGCGAMMSFIVPEQLDKMDAFLQKLHFAHYAPTLGGCCTSLQHPCTSSHAHVADDVRRQMGITPGMIRLSVGLESSEDLIEDFAEALKVFE